MKCCWPKHCSSHYYYRWSVLGLPSAAVLAQLSPKEQTRQIAIQELISTEENYMADMSVVTEVNLHFCFISILFVCSVWLAFHRNRCSSNPWPSRSSYKRKISTQFSSIGRTWSFAIIRSSGENVLCCSLVSCFFFQCRIVATEHWGSAWRWAPTASFKPSVIF